MLYFSSFVFALLLMLGGCASPPKPVLSEQNVFLGEYSFEKVGKDDHHLFSYWHRHVNWRSYNEVLVEPVMVDFAPESKLKQMAHADRVQLQEYVESCLREELRRLFVLAMHPGPNTLRVQLTLVDAQTSSELTGMMAFLHPSPATQAGLQNVLSSMGLQGFRADLKGEVTDSTTGDLLMAAANGKDDDEPWDGARGFDGGVQELVKMWVSRFSLQLCQHQGHSDCASTKAGESGD
jgi:Protein of unknown function (DUF3313)